MDVSPTTFVTYKKADDTDMVSQSIWIHDTRMESQQTPTTLQHIAEDLDEPNTFTQNDDNQELQTELSEYISISSKESISSKDSKDLDEPNTLTPNDDSKEIQTELSEYISISQKESKDESNMKQTKRKKEEDEEDEDTVDVLTGIYLRTMYPLNRALDKTVTIGLFRSLDFQPAVLLSHSTRTSIMFSIDVWDNFTKYCPIVGTFLKNNLTGKKTSIVLHDSDIEVDSLRLRSCQFIRFRNLSKHHKKILLSRDEFCVLSNLVPAISRYINQLVRYEPCVVSYLKAAVLNTPAPMLMYGSVDTTFYNKLPQEVEGYRNIDEVLTSTKYENTEVTQTCDPESNHNDEYTQSTSA